MDVERTSILLIDDDADLSAMLAEFLESEGLQVDIAPDGMAGLTRALGGEYAAVILDIMMPRMNGIEVLRKLREASDVPVIMLTAKGDEIDRVVGLELGADDYVAKPYSPRELVARVRAILRRQAIDRSAGAAPAKQIERGPLALNIPARIALWQGETLDLTASEFNILVVLARAGNDVATKDDISLRGLGRARQSYDRSVDVHVSNLRQKLDARAGGIATIETVRAVGYRLLLQ